MINLIKTGLLLSLLSIGILLMGQAMGGQQGLILAFGFALVMNVGSYWFSDKIVLAMTKARPITPEQDPRYHRMVERLCERAGLPKPALYVIPDHTPNAFATGRDPKHSAVAVNEGLLRLLNEQELEGVVAHELAHIKNRDTLISTVAATIVSAIYVLATMARWGAILGGSRDRDGGNAIALLVMSIVAPIGAMIIQLWISRTREYQADITGSEICGRPLALASALQKLDQFATRARHGEVSPATAHLYIINPLGGRQAFSALFATHPPIEERVRRLEELSQASGPKYSWR